MVIIYFFIMTIEKITQQLTKEKRKTILIGLQKTTLPSNLQKWVTIYQKVGKRNDFIWKWTYEASKVMMFVDTPKKYERSLIEVKFLMIMLIVLLDDVSDKMQNKRLLNEIIKVPFEEKYIDTDHLSKEEKQYLQFTLKLWHSIRKELQKYPYYDRFKSIINFDIAQVLNGIKYAYLVNKNLNLTNEIEFYIYLSHNTPTILSYMFDLTCMPGFNIEKLGVTRKIMWYIQAMARISNWLTTWKREVEENDFASGIFCYAIENGIIEVHDLQKREINLILKKIDKSETEKYLEKKWESFYKKIQKIIEKDKSIEGKRYLNLTKSLTILHLISKGFI